MNDGKNDFGRVYWLSGAPCAGKSSIAKMLANRHGLFLYSTDEHVMGGHLPGADGSKYPALARARSLSDAYFERPVDLILETTFAYLREDWEFVLSDLRRLPADRGVVVEGVGLFPDLVLSVAAKERVVCIVPTEDFYSFNQPRRPTTERFLERSPDPAAAFERMSEEHAELTRYFVESSARYGIRVFRTSSDESLLENLALIENWFGLGTRT